MFYIKLFEDYQISYKKIALFQNIYMSKTVVFSIKCKIKQNLYKRVEMWMKKLG